MIGLMYDDRFYSQTYDLYRPTLTTSDSHEQTWTLPGTATSTDNKCLFMETPGLATQAEHGIDAEYDATLWFPYSDTLQPAARGGQPDVIEIGSRKFIVLAAWAPAGRTLYKKALLQEQRT